MKCIVYTCLAVLMISCVEVKLSTQLPPQNAASVTDQGKTRHVPVNDERVLAATLYGLVHAEMANEKVSMEARTHILVQDFVNNGVYKMYCSQPPSPEHVRAAEQYIQNFTREMVACMRGSDRNLSAKVFSQDFECAKGKSCQGGFFNFFCF
jgi:hypothetical protein